MEDALSLAADLQRRGLEAMALPCIEREPVQWPQWPSSEAIQKRALVFLTSLAAARGVSAWWQAHPEQPKALAAMAPRTSHWLADQRLTVDVTATDGAVSLARAVLKWNAGQPLQVLYPTSDAGEQQPEQAEAVELLEREARVTRAVVYRTLAPPNLAASMRELSAPSTRWFFASPSAVSNAVAALKESRVAPAIEVVCLGQSTLRAWDTERPAPWPAGRLLASGTSLADDVASHQP